MKKTRFSEEQMVTILRDSAERSVPEVDSPAPQPALPILSLACPGGAYDDRRGAAPQLRTGLATLSA